MTEKEVRERFRGDVGVRRAVIIVVVALLSACGALGIERFPGGETAVVNRESGAVVATGDQVADAVGLLGSALGLPAAGAAALGLAATWFFRRRRAAKRAKVEQA